MTFGKRLKVLYHNKILTIEEYTHFNEFRKQFRNIAAHKPFYMVESEERKIIISEYKKIKKISRVKNNIRLIEYCGALIEHMWKICKKNLNNDEIKELYNNLEQKLY